MADNFDYGKVHEALFSACIAGDLEGFQRLLDQGAEIDFVDENDNQPIHWAALHGQLAIAELLLRKRVSVKAKGQHGRQALHCAAHACHTAMAELLLANGADIHALSRSPEHSALQTAASAGSELTIALLMSFSAKINQADNHGDTALHLASKSAQASVATVQALISLGADPDAENKIQQTPLSQAALAGNLDRLGCLMTVCSETTRRSVQTLCEDLGLDAAAKLLRAQACRTACNGPPIDGPVPSPMHAVKTVQTKQ